MASRARHLWKRLNGEGVGAVILRGSSVSFMVTVTGTALGMLITFALARILGVEAFGQYSVALGWAMLLVMPMLFGMDFTVLRFAPVYFAQDDRRALGGLLGFALCAVALLSIVALVALTLTHRLAPAALGIGGEGAGVLIAALAAVTALVALLSSVFRAAKSIFASQVYRQAVRPVLFGLALLAIVVFGRGAQAPDMSALDASVLDASALDASVLDARTAFALMLGAAALALVALVVHLRRFLSGRGQFPEWARAPRVQRREWLGLAGPAFLSASLRQVLVQGGTVALGIFALTAEAGQFAVALRLATLVTFVLSALDSITAPMIVEANHKNDPAELQRIATFNARIATVAAGSLGLGLALSSPWLLPLFGEGFIDAQPALIILCAGNVFVAVTGSSGMMLIMSNRQNMLLLTSVLGVIVFVLVFVITPTGERSAITAGLSFALAVMASKGLQAVLCWKYLKVNPLPIAFTRAS